MKRMTLHILLGILLWSVFGYYWVLVVQQPVTQHTKFALSVVGSLVGVITLILVWWIIHNVRIFKRVDRRAARRAFVQRPTADFLKRKYVIENEAVVLHARYIDVIVETDASGEERKVLRPIDEF